YNNTFTSTEHLVNQIKAYIHWYNNKRIQERLEDMTPNEYRNHALAA
ncbi:IS3 family transposase, partial [Actinomyces sp.]